MRTDGTGVRCANVANDATRAVVRVRMMFGGTRAAWRACQGTAKLRIQKRPAEAERRAGPEWAVDGPQGGMCGDHSVTEQEIEAKVIEIVAEQMNAEREKITRDTSFVDDLNADSLDTVELVMEFEDEFETSIPDDQAEKIQTVGQATDFIKQAQGVD